MSADTRFRTALRDGQLILPDGQVSVLRPPAGYDLAGIATGETVIVHSFAPDALHWEARGMQMAQMVSPCAVALVVLPRSKALGKAMIAEASAQAELVIVDGAKTDGVDSHFKACRKRLGPLPSLTKDHGRLFWFERTDAFTDWAMPEPEAGPEGFVTLPGVFSEGAVDPGSALLAAALPARLPRRMADLGAGWGYLSRTVLERDGVEVLDLVEAENLALRCARQNVKDDRARFHWADATTWSPELPCDGIVMNPPFHTGRAGDPALGQAFIRAAARVLSPQGKLWMVANRHLPYEASLRDLFRHVEELPGTGGFKLFLASRPKR